MKVKKKRGLGNVFVSDDAELEKEMEEYESRYNRISKVWRDNFKAMEESDRLAKETNSLVGRYIRHQIADGYAYYQIIKENKNSVRIKVVTGIGDDWILPAWGSEYTMRKNEVSRHIESREWYENLFK